MRKLLIAALLCLAPVLAWSQFPTPTFDKVTLPNAPVAGTDATNKTYVDTHGGGGDLSSPPPIGNVTPNSGAFTTLDGDPVFTGTPTFANAQTTSMQQLPVTVQAAAYASGNSVGGLLAFTNAARNGHSSGLVQSVLMSIPDAQALTLDVVFFNANPTGSTITDRAAISVVAADQGKILGVAHVSDCTGYSTPTLCQVQQLAMPFVLASGQTLYAAIVSRGAFTPSNLPVGAPSWFVSLVTLQD